MSDLHQNPHVIYGEYVTAPVSFHLSPSQWQVILVDIREDFECLQSNELSLKDAELHVEDCAEEFINVAETSDFIMQSIKANGISQGLKPYQFHNKLNKFLMKHDIDRTFIDYNNWATRGFIWGGLHSDICLSSNITSTRLTYPHFHNYILQNCTSHMLPQNHHFMHDYARQAWNNVTLLNTNHSTFEVITYD